VAVAPQYGSRGIIVLAFLALMYGFVAFFILNSLERNRREALVDGPVLSFAGHGLMAASATGAALVIGFAIWSNFVH
jgi:hypothetical protein